jgi:hypothetical protein
MARSLISPGLLHALFSPGRRSDRWIRIFFPASGGPPVLLVEAPTQRRVCHPGNLDVASCLSQSPPRTLSRTLTRPADAQAETPCSPLHRLVEDLRSHRLPSLGSSFLVGRERPCRCPGRSARAAVGNPPLLKSWSTCGAAPLSPLPAVCWHQLAEALCPLFGGAWARRCSAQPCRGCQLLDLGQPRRGGSILPALLRSPRIALASRPPRPHSPARSTSAPSGWNPQTPSSNPGRARCGSCPDASAPLGTHIRVPAEVSPRPLWLAGIRY